MTTHHIKGTFGSGLTITTVKIRYADADAKDGTRAALITVTTRTGKTTFDRMQKRCRLHVSKGGNFIRENGPKRKAYRPGVMIYKGICPAFHVFLEGNNFDGSQISIDALGSQTLQPSH